MGSDIHVTVVGGAPGLIDRARARIDELEGKWSRFRPESEISRLNDAAGAQLQVSDDTKLLLHYAMEAWRITGGGFDPTLLDALQRAGYDRSYDSPGGLDRPAADGADALQVPALAMLRPGVTDIVLATEGVTLPAGMGFDPGGIGKGLTADVTCGLLMDEGARGACVNMGGDLRVLGISPDGAGWTLAIEHPAVPEPIALVGVGEGAVATSSVLRRTWQIGGQARHHLIDPATGEPSTSDLALVSVISGTAWKAEVLAKAVLLRGSERAFDLLDASAVALTVDHDGRVRASDGFVAHLGGVPLPEVLTLTR